MTNISPLTAKMSKHLSRLSALCDSGFALAVRIRYTRPTLLYRTYAQDWIDTYTEKGFMLSDPVVHWGLSHTGVALWTELANNDPDGVLASALAHGLFNGVTYSTGSETSRTISGLTRSTHAFTGDELAEIAAIVDDVHAMTEGFEALPTAEQDGLRSLLQG